MSSGPFVDVLRDPFGEEDGFVLGKGRKKTNFARDSGSWRYMSRTPSPVENGIDYDSSRGTEDEDTQEKDNVFGDDVATGSEDVSDAEELGLGSPEHAESHHISRPNDVPDLGKDGVIESQSILPMGPTPNFLPLGEMPPPPLRHADQGVKSPQRSPKILTPRLEPLASPGLPLVSPLVKQPGIFAEGYFPPNTTESSELDASAEVDRGNSEDGHYKNVAISGSVDGLQGMEGDRRLKPPDLQSDAALGMGQSIPLPKTEGIRHRSPSAEDFIESSGESPAVSPQQTGQHLQTETTDSGDSSPLRGYSDFKDFVDLPPPYDSLPIARSLEASELGPDIQQATSAYYRSRLSGYDGSSSDMDAPEKNLSFGTSASLLFPKQENRDPNLTSSQQEDPNPQTDMHEPVRNDSTFLQRQQSEELPDEASTDPEYDKIEEDELSSTMKPPTQMQDSADIIKIGSYDGQEPLTPLDPALMAHAEVDEEEDAEPLRGSPTVSLAASDLRIQNGSRFHDSHHTIETREGSGNDSTLSEEVGTVKETKEEQVVEESKAMTERIKEDTVEEELVNLDIIEEESIENKELAEEDLIEEKVMVKADLFKEGAVKDVMHKEQGQRKTEEESESTVKDVKPTQDQQDDLEPIEQERVDFMRPKPGNTKSSMDSKLITPNDTQESTQASPLAESEPLPMPGLITPERSQNLVKLQDMTLNKQQSVAGKAKQPKLTPMRRSSRISQRPQEMDKPQVSSPWFTPRHSIQTPPTKEGPGSIIHVAPTRSRSGRSSPDHDPSDKVRRKLTKAPLNKGFQTPKAWFPTLSSLRSSYYNQIVDIIALSTSKSTPPKRAPSGPRDHYVSLHITDPSMHGNSAPVQVFRPFKPSLPFTERGETILLRNFKVQSVKGAMALLSTESSGWAVFHQSSNQKDKSRNSAAKDHVTIVGPPVEYGQEEILRASDLSIWWQEEGSELFPEIINSDLRITRSLKKAESSDVPQSERKDSAQHSEADKKYKHSESPSLAPPTLHELRDGTRYFDPMPGSSPIVAHELRDGTKWFDNVPREGSEARPGSRG